jgi:hypothetical protein
MPFRGDHTVLTSDESSLPIAHLAGDFLITMNGKSNFMSSRPCGVRKMVGITLNNGVKLACTEDVAIAVVNADKPTQKFRPSQCLRYVDAIEMKAGDTVVYRQPGGELVLVAVKYVSYHGTDEAFSFDCCSNLFVNNILCYVNDIPLG